MMRYYIANSSWFDTHPYNRPKIVKAVRAGGGTNVRQSNAFGWSNQPKVVTFDSTPSKVDRVKKSVQKALATPWIIVSDKNW